jgi:hypothetical protein
MESAAVASSYARRRRPVSGEVRGAVSVAQSTGEGSSPPSFNPSPPRPWQFEQATAVADMSTSLITAVISAPVPSSPLR